MSARIFRRKAKMRDPSVAPPNYRLITDKNKFDKNYERIFNGKKRKVRNQKSGTH